MNILISGAGIAGPTLAYWLLQYGMKPTIIEKAPALRNGGYVVDFWGAGFDIADRMGLSEEIRNHGYQVQEVRIVNRKGERVSDFPTLAFVRSTRGRYTSLARGVLASSIFKKIEGRVETIFNDCISSIEQSHDLVHVHFGSGQERDFDVVVGADGLHSQVRDLVLVPRRSSRSTLGTRQPHSKHPVINRGTS